MGVVRVVGMRDVCVGRLASTNHWFRTVMEDANDVWESLCEQLWQGKVCVAAEATQLRLELAELKHARLAMIGLVLSFYPFRLVQNWYKALLYVETS